MNYKFIRVSNEQEYNKAVKYFEAMGYKLSTNIGDDVVYKENRTTACVAGLNDEGIWASRINWYTNEISQEHFLPEEVAKDKFIMVANKEEADKAVEYFKGLGYYLGNFAPEYSPCNTSVVVQEEGGDIWHSNLDVEYYLEERHSEWEQHFLPQEPIILQNIYIPINNEEEFNQAKLLVEQMGYVARIEDEEFNQSANITCENGSWYGGGAPEDGVYFEGRNIDKYFLKSNTTYTLEKAPEKLYEVTCLTNFSKSHLTKAEIENKIKQLQEIIGE